MRCSQMDTFVTLSHVTMRERYQFMNNVYVHFIKII
jgi:hypothetical protein